ncbi:MAG TPA: UDP-N-acetylmuramate dehydrogenase [Polyangiaceae bacterium]|nr:UDP-N-acetylmuramate dehydrogenase [Polyangiaceae bacterium]
MEREEPVKIEAEVELASRSTLGVGGRAAHFARVTSEAELGAALAWANARALDVRVLGGGSNIVVADGGFDGLVLEIATRGIVVSDDGASALVRAAAGEPWDELVEAMISRDYQGLECLSGIPGRVGATPIQNVGAYGQEVSETITEVVAFDRTRAERVIFSGAECAFSYRDSRFKSREPGRFVVTEVCFRLRPHAPPAIRYAELERWFSERPGTPSLADTRAAVLHLRRAKSMLLDASDPNGRSCGSFFTNPILSPDEARAFTARAQGTGKIPSFPQSDGRVKLSAGWLIEHAGFARGTRSGAVGLSTQHALALVAHDGARAEDIVRFAQLVQRGVWDRFGVKLESEPVFWGFPGGKSTLPAAEPA